MPIEGNEQFECTLESLNNFTPEALLNRLQFSIPEKIKKCLRMLNVKRKKINQLSYLFRYFTESIEKANEQNQELPTNFVKSVVKLLPYLGELFNETKPHFLKKFSSLLLATLKISSINEHASDLRPTLDLYLNHMENILKNYPFHDISHHGVDINSLLEKFSNILHAINDVNEIVNLYNQQISTTVKHISQECLQSDRCNSFTVLKQLIRNLGTMSQRLVKNNKPEEANLAIKTAKHIFDCASNKLPENEIRDLAWTFLNKYHHGDANKITTDCKRIFNLTSCQTLIPTSEIIEQNTTTLTTIIPEITTSHTTPIPATTELITVPFAMNSSTANHTINQTDNIKVIPTVSPVPFSESPSATEIIKDREQILVSHLSISTTRHTETTTYTATRLNPSITPTTQSSIAFTSTPQSTAATAPNSTLNEVSSTPNMTGNVLDSNPTIMTPLDNDLLKLGLASAIQGAVAGTVHTVTTTGITCLKAKDYLKGWREPLAKISTISINSMIIATLPLMLSHVEDESEQSESIFEKIVTPTLYALGSSLVFEGINYIAQYSYHYFNGKKMSPESVSKKTLDSLPLLANISLFINEGYHSTEAAVIVGSNIAGVALALTLTRSLHSLLFSKTRRNLENAENDIEMGSKNLIPLLPVKLNTVENKTLETNSFIFEEDAFNLDSQFQTLATNAFTTKNTSNLDEFLNDPDKIRFKDPIKTQAFFLKNLILLSMRSPEIGLCAYTYLQSQKRLQARGKNLEENCSIIPFALTETEKLEAHTNKESETDKTITQFKKLVGSFIAGLNLNIKGFGFSSKILALGEYSFEKISINYGSNKILNILIPSKFETNSANNRPFDIERPLEEIARASSAANMTYCKFLLVLPIQSTIPVKEYNCFDNTPKLKKLSQFKLNDPFPSYYFIKEYIKNFLKDCLFPDNATPDLLEGLLSTFICNLKLTGLESKTEKIDPIENNEDSLIDDHNLTHKVASINRKRDSAIAVCQTLCSNTDILSIFKSIPPDNTSNSKVPRIEVVDRLLNKRKLEIQNNKPRIDLLPLAYKKGIAVIEIITKKESCTLDVHDPLNLIQSIHSKLTTLAEKNGYHYTLNSKCDYSSDWKSEERCQLAAYYFIKESTLNYLKFSCPINANLNNDNKPLPAIILEEIKDNLKLKHEYGIDESTEIKKIKRCDGGVFNLRNYIADVSNYLNILRIETTLPLENKSDLGSEIQRNLGLADLDSNQSGSIQEVTLWNSVRLDNWSELFSKEIILSQTSVDTVHYLLKFPSAFFFSKGKMAILAKQEDNESTLLSSIRNLLVYDVSHESGNKCVKKALWTNDLNGLFSKFTTNEHENQKAPINSFNNFL